MILDSDIFVMQTLMVFMESESDRSSSRTLPAANLATRRELHISEILGCFDSIQRTCSIQCEARVSYRWSIVLLQSVYIQQLEQQTCL